MMIHDKLVYDDIVSALFSGEAGTRIPDGLSFSYPVPTKDETGALVDNFFLYSVNRASGRPSSPSAYIGIYAETSALAYHRKTPVSLEPFAVLGVNFTLQERPAVKIAPLPVRGPSMKEMKALIAEYKRLYPTVRQFAFSQFLVKSKQDQLEKFFHTQRRLFGSQLGDYRHAAPEFYSWMIRLLSTRISFLDLLKNRQVKVSDAADYLKMAADDEEKQILLGLNDDEFTFWRECGNNALRLILCGRVLKVNVAGFACQGDPALVAARSYDPASAAKRRIHEKRTDEVRQIARSLREEHNLQLPVDLNALAEKLGIQVDRVDLNPEIDGYVKLDCDGEVITINEKARRGYPPRKRFTLAHEIGHVVIPWHTGTTACVTDSPTVMIDQKRLVDSQEREANVFASELLIPSDWLRERMEKSENLEKLLESVRQKTKASVLACLYAMEQVLPEGQVICVTSTAMNGWKFFRGPKVSAWKSEKDAFAALEQSFELTADFKKGSYTIRHYRKKN